MAEYIDREALIDSICAGCGWDGICTARCIDLRTIRDFPAADVAPVARCKDCVEWQKDWEPRAANNGEHFCPIVGLVTAPEWYCADGNREGGWK